MQNRYIPRNERLQQTIQTICDNHWISKLEEVKLDSKQIAALGQAALIEWQKVLPKNKNILHRLFDKPWDANSIQFYDKILKQLGNVKDAISLKFFFELTQTLQTDNPQLTKDKQNLIQWINNNIGRKLPFFSEQMEIYSAHVEYLVKQLVNTYFLIIQGLIQEKNIELLNKLDQTEIEMNFIKIASSESGYTAWERLNAYFLVDGSNKENFFNELITQLKLQFMPREEPNFISFKSIG
jgi:hypothetical protein